MFARAVDWRAGGDRDRRRRARAGRARGRSSACRTRRSSAPTGRGRTCWLVVAIPCFAGAVALVPTLLQRASRRVRRGAVRRSRWSCGSRSASPAAGTHRLDSALFVGVRAARARTSTCRRLRGVRLRPALLPRPLRRARARRCRCTAPATRPGCCWSMHYLGLDTAPRLAAFCIVVGALSAPLTYVLAQARSSRRRDARIAGVLAAFAPAHAALRRDLAPTRSTSRSACSPRSR